MYLLREQETNERGWHWSEEADLAFSQEKALACFILTCGGTVYLGGVQQSYKGCYQL
jgi:hypothetical protein